MSVYKRHKILKYEERGVNLVDLEQTVENGVVHVLHVALARLDCTNADKILPADD